MKIHYISHHSILEYDEVQLFLDLGHEVFSNGAYIDPAGHISHPRPGLKGAKYYPHYAELARTTPKTELPSDLIEPFDVIIIMHSPDVLIENWSRIRHKRVIWRSIGQSVPRIEKMLQPLKEDGLIIVRYSPKERAIEPYAGENYLIRFYKDENEYQGWTGEGGGVVNFSQSLKGRRDFCHYDEIMQVVEAFGGKVYGPDNEDLGQYNGGQVPYEKQLEVMRGAGVMVYGGTWPAPYTLSFIEALMMGLPIVSISKKLAHMTQHEHLDFFEADEVLVEAGGIVCDDGDTMVQETQKLLEDGKHARKISERQRGAAMKYFSKREISKQWKEVLS